LRPAAPSGSDDYADDYDTPAYIGGVYQLWGYNATSDVAVSVEECVARCRDIPPGCGAGTGSCGDTCLPGSGTVVADAPAPELGLTELSAFMRALAHAGGVPPRHVSLLSITPVTYSLASAMLTTQEAANICGTRRTLGWFSTQGYSDPGCSQQNRWRPVSCLAAVGYYACPYRHGAHIAFQLQTPSALAPAVLANLRSAFQLTGMVNSVSPYGSNSVSSLTVASTFVTLMQAVGLSALDLAVPAPRAYQNNMYGNYLTLNLNDFEGLRGELHVTGTPATTDSAQKWLAPPPPAWPFAEVPPRQPPPPPALGSCPGWPGSCAAGTSGRCQDPVTRICYANAPGTDACWQSSAVLCAHAPPPPSPPPVAPLPPPVQLLSPPPPPSDARQYAWSTRGAFKYGRPRLTPSPALGWAAAERACVAVGGHLASVHSEEEAAFIATTVLPDFYCSAPANPQCWNGCAMTCPDASTCAAGCGCAVYAWLGLQLDLRSRSWNWTDASALDYSAWACGAPADIFADLSGTARPFALLSNGGALACGVRGAPRIPSGDPAAGLWSNSGFAFNGQFEGNSYPQTSASSLAPAYGKFMAGGSQQACSEDGLGAAPYEYDAPYNSATGSYPRNFQYDAACLYTSSMSYVCKVPL
jgi:hypothetical protein